MDTNDIYIKINLLGHSYSWLRSTRISWRHKWLDGKKMRTRKTCMLMMMKLKTIFVSKKNVIYIIYKLISLTIRAAVIIIEIHFDPVLTQITKPANFVDN